MFYFEQFSKVEENLILFSNKKSVYVVWELHLNFEKPDCLLSVQVLYPFTMKSFFIETFSSSSKYLALDSFMKICFRWNPLLEIDSCQRIKNSTFEMFFENNKNRPNTLLLNHEKLIFKNVCYILLFSCHS